MRLFYMSSSYHKVDTVYTSAVIEISLYSYFLFSTALPVAVFVFLLLGSLMFLMLPLS